MNANSCLTFTMNKSLTGPHPLEQIPFVMENETGLGSIEWIQVHKHVYMHRVDRGVSAMTALSLSPGVYQLSQWYTN